VLPDALAAAAAMLQANGCDTAASAAAASSAEQDFSGILDISHTRSSGYCSTAAPDQSGTGSGTNSYGSSNHCCDSKGNSKADGPADAASIQQMQRCCCACLQPFPAFGSD